MKRSGIVCIYIIYYIYNEIKSVAYSFQGNHTGQLDFSNLLVDDSTTVTVISITLRRLLMSDILISSATSQSSNNQPPN